jgi:hypothetical protein
MNVILSLYNKISKEVLLYSLLAFSGIVYLSRGLFTKRSKKSFYNRDKKKNIRKFQLLFNDINKRVIVRNKDTPTEDKLNKMNAYIEKVQQHTEKGDEEEKKLVSRQDKIFFYIFKNVMLVQNK